MRQNEADGQLAIHFHSRQHLAFESEATELLFGGAAGPGKSHLLRIASITWCAEIPGLQVYLFRRIRDDLVKNHMEGPKGYRMLLAPWVLTGFCRIVDDEIRFWNGSKIYLCHCKDEKDRFQYQGSEIHVLLIDELTHFTDVIYRFLRGRVRAIGLDIPEKYRGRFPRILCGSNPGNIGHAWVKKAWIDGALDLELRRMPKSEGGMLRQFIAARLEDNPSLLEDDPDYETRLEGLGSKALVQAMRFGDWDVIEGAFFDEWDPRKHIIKPFAIPAHWARFQSIDWGSAVPFSVGWWAIVPDEIDSSHINGMLRITVGGRHGYDYEGHGDYRNDLPRGALVRYREWYGSPDHSNKGLKLYAEEVAAGIAERENSEPRNGSGRPNILYRVIDPSAFKQDGGPSIAERFAHDPYRILCRPADNARVSRRGALGGWDMVRSRLRGQGGRPMLYVFSTCVDLIRTLPVVQHDPDNPEDIMNCEDHAVDETRYACMSRPYIPDIGGKEPPEFPIEGLDGGRIAIRDTDDPADWEEDDYRPKSNGLYERIR